MSISWSLHCVECGESFNLGKSVKFQSPINYQETYGFWTGSPSPEQAQAFYHGIRHFMMRHRLHELRVIPDNLHVNTGVSWFDYDDEHEFNLHHLLSLELSTPDPTAEAAALPENLIARIDEGGKKADRAFPVDED